MNYFKDRVRHNTVKVSKHSAFKRANKTSVELGVILSNLKCKNTVMVLRNSYNKGSCYSVLL